MKTLAQIRAQNALRCYGQRFGGAADGEVIKKMPMRIQTDGILATLAFCHAKNEDHRRAAQIIVDHLCYEGIEVTESDTLLALIAELARKDAQTLRRATAEALALLNYMKRFAD